MSMKKSLILSSALFLAACSSSPGMEHMEHAESSSSMPQIVDRLSTSPRHQEWVEVKSGDRTIYTWVVYPETDKPAPVVILIHENKGLNDWARSMADQIAEAGYIAVAPDMLSGFSADKKRTSDFAMPDEATKAIGQLKPEQVTSDLQAVTDWSKTIPSSNKQLVSAGFCWGGSQSFSFATKTDDLTAAMVFYGTGPSDANAYKNIDVPVFGFYGGADQRVNATIDASKKAMTDAGKSFESVIYDGAGHAFMRSGQDPNGDAANVAARDAAWERMKEILATLSE